MKIKIVVCSLVLMLFTSSEGDFSAYFCTLNVSLTVGIKEIVGLCQLLSKTAAR